MKKLTLLFIYLFIYTALSAQYYQFSQFNYSDQRVNPGAISLSDYATADLIYRSQDTSPELKLRSFMLSAKYPIIAKNGGKRWSSIGVSMGEDQTGLGGVVVFNELGLSYALNFSTGKNQTVSVGTKINYHSRKINTDALNTGTQFVPGIGFDQGLTSGEQLTQSSRNFMSLGGGIIWQEDDRNKKRIRHLGLSLFDINRPNESLFGSNSPMPSTLVLETGYRVFENQLVSIYPELLYTYSTATSNLSIGTVTSYSLDYINARSAGSSLEFHTKYLLDQGAMIGVQLVNDVFSAGISYDVPINGNSAHSGAFEIGLEIRKLVKSRFKSSKRSVKKTRRKRAKKARKSNRKKKLKKKNNTAKKQGKIEQTAENDLVKSKNQVEPEADETDVENNHDTQEGLPLAKDSITTNQEEVEEEIKGNTDIGNLQYESLLLEPTKLIYYFDFDSADAEKEAEDYISDLVSILEQDQLIKIKIAGHTDNVGTEAYNLILSKRRAQVIVDILSQHDISSSRIISESKGESEPLLDNLTSENRSKNRRVEITLYY